MIKQIKYNDNRPKSELIPMAYMKPLQIARIDDDRSNYNGCIVFRTRTEYNFEVMIIRDDHIANSYVSKSTDIMVELLKPGESIILELFNE